MAISTEASGTKTAGALDTIYDLATTTNQGIYIARWNLTNYIKLDIGRFFLKTKVLTGDTSEIIYEAIMANDLGASPILESPPVPSMFELIMSMEQTDGTWRDVPWSLIKISG